MIITAPDPVPASAWSGLEPYIFLAGSIEQGTAEHWQDRTARIIDRIKGVNVFNPRRAEWDASWPQDPSFAPFREQVEWELVALNYASTILMHFDPATKSPISLLELGLYAASGKMLVSCPSGFWRRGNVQIVCETHGIDLYESLEDATANLLARLLLL